MFKAEDESDKYLSAGAEQARPLQDKTKSGLSSPGRTQRFEKQRARIRSSLVQSSCGLLKASTSLVILIQSGDTGLLMTGLEIRAFKQSVGLLLGALFYGLGRISRSENRRR